MSVAFPCDSTSPTSLSEAIINADFTPSHNGCGDGKDVEPSPLSSTLHASYSPQTTTQNPQDDPKANSCVPPIFLWIIWFATCQEPLRISTIDTRRRCLPQHEDIPPENEIRILLIWLVNGESWKSASPSDLWLVIPTNARRALVRLPNALDCTTFAKEHRLLHAQLHVPIPTQWQYVSLIERVPTHNCGENLTVVAYGEHAEAPKIFEVKLTKNGELRWRDYPRLLAHVLGEAEATYPPVIFHAWYPVCDRWNDVDPDDNFLHCPDYDFLLVRNKSNERAPGLSRWLEHLSAQRYNPVGHRYSIPYLYTRSWERKVITPPSPVGSLFALSAMYLRTDAIVLPCPEMMRTRNQGSDALGTALRGSASTPNLRRYTTSTPGRITSVLDEASGADQPGSAKPLDVARKRKLSSNAEGETSQSPLRRSPHKHHTGVSAPAENGSTSGSLREKKAKTTPDNPTIYRVLGLDAAEEDVKYSRELKKACSLAAGPPPEAPLLCPRYHDFSTFESRVCYKYGLAGAWNMLCHKCRKVHIPTQVGPTEPHLEAIEAIRDRDRASQRARKEAKIRARATKKTTKGNKPREPAAKNGSNAHEDDPVPKRSRTEADSEHRPFGMLNNASKLSTENNSHNDMLRRAHREARPPQSPPAIKDTQGQHKSSVCAQVFKPEARTIVLVLWEKAEQLPFIDHITIPSGDDVFLFHHPHVRAIPPPTQFERYVFSGNVWSPIPWDISPIEVCPEDEIMFVRVMDVLCLGFGQQLHDYQLHCGHALPIQQRLAHVLYQPPKRHRWILVWDQDRAPPKIFLFDSALLDDRKVEGRVTRPWLDLLHDAPFYLIWHELYTRWRGVIGDKSPKVPDDAPIILLAHPCVEVLMGAEEAIAWLDSWRAAHKLPDGAPMRASPPKTQTSVSAMRPASSRTDGKKKAHLDIPTDLPLFVSDDKPEFICDKLPNLGTMTTTSLATKGRRPRERNPSAVIVISDDDDESLALVNEYEGKSEMYANVIRARLLTTKCAEGANVREHLDTLCNLREQLSSMGAALPDQEFSATIFQSLPKSYGYLLTALSTASRISNNPITPTNIIQALNEEYDRRTSQSPSSDSALAAYPSSQLGQQRMDIECFNYHRKGHLKSDCWRKGGGKEGQGPRDQTPKRGRRRGGSKGGPSANTATESSEHAFAITIDSAALASTATTEDRVEIFDSGATRHISPYRDEFVTYEKLQPARPITAADGHTFMAVSEGQVRVSLPNGDSSTVVMLERVLHAPDIAFSLVSIPQADKAGYSAIFENGECCLFLRSSRETVGRILSVNGLYQVRRPDVAAAAVVGRGAETEMSVLEFHRCMGHISPVIAKKMLEEGRVLGVKLKGGSTDETCDVCIQAKITRAPVPKERTSQLAKRYGERFHADTWAAGCTSLGGKKYAVMFTDNNSRWTHTIPEKEKNQAFPAYKKLDVEVETQEGHKIKVLHTDNGGEFTSNEFITYLESRGTKPDTTVHDTPEQNGVTERTNCTLAKHARAMLVDSGLPQYLWPYALLHSTWLKNRTSTCVLDGKTPYEVRYGEKPDLRGLKPFSAKVWVHLEHASKMQPKAVEGCFVRYAENEKGYLVYWPGRNKVSTERNVRFVVEPEPLVAAEDVQLEGARNEVVQPSSSASETSPTTPEPTPAENEPSQPSEMSDSIEKTPQTGGSTASLPAAVTPTDSPSSPSLPPSPTHPSATVENVPEEDAEEPAPLGRGHRIKRPSATLRQLAAGEGTIDGRPRRGGAVKLPRGLQPENLMGASAIVEEDEWSGMPSLEDPRPPHIERTREDDDEWLMALAIQAGQDPRMLKEARQSPDWPQWQCAIDAEYENLRRHDVFDLVEPPPDANIVGSKLVFRVKHNVEGTVSGFKARLVAQGFSQVPGRDYHDDETFAPVSRLPSIRTILALAARHDWELRQMDVKSAYLNGTLEETVYMHQPPSFSMPEQSHLVCRLKKTLYGLKQAGRGWYKTLTAAMLQMGFTRCVADHAVFYKREGESAIIVAASVDDLTIAGTSDLVNAFAADIKQRFEMSDLGNLHWILGIEVRRDCQARTIAISQRSYIDTTVSRFNLEDAAPLSIPLQPGSPLGQHQSPSTPRQFEDMRDVPYREAVGSLMYAAMGTRPDVTFAVTALSQFMQNPGRAHWDAIKRVLRYLKGTRELWLVYGDDNNGLHSFSDADWGSSMEHRHSISGYVFTLDGGAISWSSKKQNVVALSSTEAEYIALTHATKEAIWLRYVLADVLHPELSSFPVRLCSDNRSAIALAKDNAFHPRTKHIDIRYHFIREAVDNHNVALEYRRTEDMPTDLFTKALPHAKLEHLSRLFGLRPL
ncbi:hypothetical protein GSI_11477 [Ganoderma sinense ZZ0214-1]|uniref:Integrase catalytic domain-containing protein n=1 Tax=Ganoderma sinense ZZ0214-1 TaxID=1077348 RepID=A0A2G8RW53_9APHY|nr:hypothetical protein GSI_11477 [Ganoderma sinense ZZ0214-1]